jgi:glyoxylase-like metal-dependent hydrolase (beta-lactamase superfamily II)
MKSSEKGGRKDMALQVKALHIGDVGLDWSRLALDYNPGRKTWVPITCYLILGAETPVLVDTGFKGAKDMEAYGMVASETPEQDIVKQIRELGVKPEDVGYIIHTHLHVDHCGKNEYFPNAKMVLQRKELMFAAAELKPIHCPYLPWFIDNRGRIEFLDGDFEILPGIKCVLAIGHTGGHLHVEVDTDEGKAIMCGDNVYDIPMQLEGKHPSGKIWPIGFYYHQGLLQWELFKLKKELEKGSLILPTHEYEVFDRYKIGKKLGNKQKDYKGFASYEDLVNQS